MGTSLNGLTPAGTYPGLIKTGDNAPIDGTLKTLSDGNGNNLPMSVSTTTINLTGTAQVGGVAIANTTQLAAKQDTLVSGTNIKTINGTSVLGSGNIVTPSTNPSGVAGAIQFSDGSAFASDAANLFWNNTTKRFGIGTNAPTQALDILGNVKIASATSGLLIRDYTAFNTFKAFYNASETPSDSNYLIAMSSDVLINSRGSGTDISYNNSLRARFGNATSLLLKGSGTTSGTTSLLVQNSAGSELAKFNDDGSISFGSKLNVSTIGTINASGNVYALGGSSVQVTAAGNFRFVVGSVISNSSDGVLMLSDFAMSTFNRLQFGGTSASFPSLKRALNNFEVKNADDTFGAGISVGGTLVASAILQADSTTKGFLPPRMTTTQKNAIATPAAGLQVYDTTTNKLCCYNGSTWNDLF